MVAISSQNKNRQLIDATHLQQLIDNCSVILIDVRESAEYKREKIEGAISIPLSQFDSAKLPPQDNKTLVLYCRFLLLSGFVGAGLIFAGISGTCAMANVLMKLPDNQPQ